MRAGPDQLGESLAGKLSSNASSIISSGDFLLVSCSPRGRWRCLRWTPADFLLGEGRFVMQ
jgi:hypothetical protein